MNKKIKETMLCLTATSLSLFGGMVFWQKACFKQAQKKQDDTLFEIYPSPLGDIAYLTQGRGKTPLILIHSMMLGASKNEWDMVIEDLAKSYQVYVIDLPGFGNSFMPEKPWTAYQYANCIHDFIEHIIKRSTYIVASNGGADLALISSKFHPEKIKGMILISPEGFHQGFATNEKTKPLRHLLLPILGTQQFLGETKKSKIKETLEDAYFAKEKITKEQIENQQYKARQNQKSQVTYAQLKTDFWRANTKSAFATLSQPFWIFWGEENKKNPITNMEWAKEARPDGDYVIFEGVCNFPHMENSQSFVSVVKEYLN